MRIFTLSFLLLTMMSPAGFGQQIKQPNVSGQFYPSSARELSVQIEAYLSQADVLPRDTDIDILIAHHAGYIFSGPVAAYGYKAISQKTYRTVVVIAPSHYFRLNGFSVWNTGGFQTPLGTIEVDKDFADQLIVQNPRFKFEPKAFDREHSLEVELPFLQKTLKDFKIVPVIAGQPDLVTTKDFAESLNRLIGSRRDVLVVISTDMSHFYDAATAESMDHRTMESVQKLQVQELWDACQVRGGEMELCGIVPVSVALFLARERNLEPEILKYAHSGDVTGDRDRVVGYFSAVFSKKGVVPPADKKAQSVSVPAVNPLSEEQKRSLIEIAQDTIQEFVRSGKVIKPLMTDPRLREVEGAFVTVHKHGRLRGCIGNIIGRQPLYLTVRDMAIAAVSQDPRFDPVTPNELNDLEIEISVLSRPWQIKDPHVIEMGVHGVIISRGPFQQGVFLPQVARETGWTREEFLSNLCAHKAGLPPDAWQDPKTKIEIFTADVFSEKELK